MYNVGVVGYSGKKFNEDIAKSLMAIALDLVEENHKSDKYTLVSGLTDLGIPAIAYRMAEKRGWKTMGIACRKAQEYDCFPVDETIIIGDDWGKESDAFLDKLNCMIRIGGGKQSFEEAKKAKEMGIPVYEYDLPEINK